MTHAMSVTGKGRTVIALDEIAAERKRQIEAEGWTPEHDDAHTYGEMSLAAACYALAGGYRLADDGIRESPNPTLDAAAFIKRWWPWDWSWWKPNNRRRNLVKAGALIVAEIERLDRAASP
jgi:hypothetical protein